MEDNYQQNINLQDIILCYNILYKICPAAGQGFEREYSEKAIMVAYRIKKITSGEKTKRAKNLAFEQEVYGSRIIN